MSDVLVAQMPEDRQAAESTCFSMHIFKYAMSFRLGSAKFLKCRCMIPTSPADAAHCHVTLCDRETKQLLPVTPGFHLSGIMLTAKVKEKVEKLAS